MNQRRRRRQRQRQRRPRANVGPDARAPLRALWGPWPRAPPGGASNSSLTARSDARVPEVGATLFASHCCCCSSSSSSSRTEAGAETKNMSYIESNRARQQRRRHNVCAAEHWVAAVALGGRHSTRCATGFLFASTPQYFALPLRARARAATRRVGSRQLLATSSSSLPTD